MKSALTAQAEAAADAALAAAPPEAEAALAALHRNQSNIARCSYSTNYNQ